MNHASSNSLRLLDWLRYLLARLGWPGSVGLVLLLAAWLVQSLDVQPRIEMGLDLEQQADRLARKASSVIVPEVTQPAELSQTLPGEERIPEAVARLFAAARHAGLDLKQGVYRPAGEKATGILRYQITLPVTATYPEIRDFIAESLERESSLALDGFRLARTQMNSDQIDAELRFTLFVGAAR